MDMGQPTSPRRYRILAILFCVCAAVMLTVALTSTNFYDFASIGSIGYLALALVVLFLLTAREAAKSSAASPQAPAAPSQPETLPPQPQPFIISKRLRILWILLGVIPPGTIFVASDLYQLESGPARNAMIAWPIQFAYLHLGFWPTLLGVPLLGLLCIAAILFLPRKLLS
jgi:hypothetical protein